MSPAREAVVALGLEAVGELRAALLDDPAVDEDVHEVRLDVAQDARVVGDEQHAEPVAVLGTRFDALGDDLERVDVEAGVGLVEDGDLRLEQLHLEDLVALLLAAGEALVDVALGEVGVHPQASIAPLTSLTHVRSLGASPSIAVLAVRRKFETVTPGISTGYCMARKSPARARSSTLIASTSSPSSVTVPLVTVYFGWPGDRVGERGLARAVRAHDRVGLARADGEVDAAEDLLGALLGLDADVEVADLEGGHRVSSPSRRCRRR